jgi:hypothetical protein
MRSCAPVNRTASSEPDRKIGGVLGSHDKCVAELAAFLPIVFGECRNPFSRQEFLGAVSQEDDAQSDANKNRFSAHRLSYY